ncbi:lipid kinase YegS [Stappia sp.]|uniref:lipid kinase YegS n=1 Tax=Stappia sp. TaxID=1870903 RepID=UPI003C7EB43D
MTETRRLFLILNGKSAPREDVRAAVAAVRDAGHELEVRVTYEPGDVARFVGEALGLGARPDVIVAGGGDGTLNQVVAALLEADEPADAAASGYPAVGVLPLGTANDFAVGLELPADDPGAALRLCAEGEIRTIDAARINERVFVNLASGGTVTQITREADPRAKRLFGGAAYLIAGASHIGRLAPSTARFSAEGFSWEGEFLAMAIGNGRLAGGGVPLCPEARLDDGLLDLTLFPQPDADHVLGLLSRLLHETEAPVESYAKTTRFSSLTVESDAELSLNLDGEPMQAKSLKVEVLPGAVRFVTGPAPKGLVS